MRGTSKVEFRVGNRRVTSKALFEALEEKGIQLAVDELSRRSQATAASIVDPDSGKHPPVFVRQAGRSQPELTTQGTPAYANELDRRLGGTQMETGMVTTPGLAAPIVYLAHASEDHETLAKPLAEALLANGIDVWLDGWEISTGDSLRQKMDAGLQSMTHFVVLLTPNSLRKPWVQREIDAGFVRLVGGQSKFMGLRVGVSISELTPYLATLRSPEIDVRSKDDVDTLVGDIYGVSRKPNLGPKPRYVRTVPSGLAGWSASAAIVAEYLVRHSQRGMKHDPQTTPDEIAKETGLPVEDVRLGVLDLKDSGLVEESREIGSSRFWPTNGLFPVFDAAFMDFDPQADAVSAARWLVNQGTDKVDTSSLAEAFSDWPPRQLNSALTFLEEARIIAPQKAIGSAPWTMVAIRIDDRTRRFVRDHG